MQRLAVSVAAGTHVDPSTVTGADYLEAWLTDTVPVTVEASTMFSY